jgi:hypothetical protein
MRFDVPAGFARIPFEFLTAMLYSIAVGRRPRLPALFASVGLSGEILRPQKRGNRPNNFVLAGLGPAIHAVEEPKQRRGCADQVRARRLGVI